MPAVVELVLTSPPGFASAEEFRQRLVAALEDHEQRAALAMATDRRTFLGSAAVRAQSPTASPASREAHCDLNPRVAGFDKWKRIEALRRLKAFLCAYRVAWEALRRGAHHVLFPCGTYALRVRLGVRCEAPG